MLNLKHALAGMGAAAALMATTGVARAELNEAVSFEAGVDYASKYVWRGIELNEDFVVQPSFTMNWGNFSANIWASVDTTDFNDRRWDAQEVDYTLSYNFSCGNIDYSTGIIYYDFPGTKGDSATREVFLGMSAGNCLLQPSLTVYYDFDEANGFYVNAGVGHSMSFCNERLSLDLAANVGWGDEDYHDYYFDGNANRPVRNSGPSDLKLGVSATYALNSAASITPYVAYTTLLDADLRDTASDEGVYISGINFSYSF